MGMAAVCLVQGASRGIGLAFCRALLARSANSSVIATCRRPSAASELQTLQIQYPQRLTVLSVDVTDSRQIEDAASFVKEQHGRLDLLINSAGILHPSGKGETSLKDVNQEGLEETFQINTIGPLLVAKYFASLLSEGRGLFGRQGADAKHQHTAILINISAHAGSFADNAVGGWYSYRMSKAALNMATKNLSIELGRGRKKIVCVSVHPGSVDTDLSRPYQKSMPHLLTVEHSVNSLMSVIDSISLEDSGKFLSYDRKVMLF